jgi:hypothetical protein
VQGPKNRREEEGVILMFQVDHLSGEEMGWILEAERIPGLKNKHLISTLTKKGRPGYLLLLDVDPGLEAKAVGSVAEFLPVFGFHRFSTKHVFTKGISRVVSLVVHANGRRLEGTLHVRSFSSLQGGGRHFIESDDLAVLHRRIKKELNTSVSRIELKERIDARLKGSAGDRISIRL